MFTGTEMLHTLRGFLFDEKRIMTLRTLSSQRFEVDDKLTLRIAIAGVKRFAITGTPLDKMTRLALRTDYCCFIRLVDELGVIARRIVTASNKHTESSLSQHQLSATCRTKLTLQNFDNMSVRGRFQRTDVIAFWIV